MTEYDKQATQAAAVPVNLESELHIVPQTLSHQRPDDVLGEWSNIPETDWNIHQRIAEKTGGWGTVANVVSLLGGIATVKGGIEYARGNKAVGIAYVAGGRLLDLADGYVAKHFGTRGKTGALVDAGIDKALTLGAAVELAVTDTIEPVYAAALVVQQGRIVAQNVAIEKAGGNPNPSEPGKHAMFTTWLGAGARAIEKTIRPSHPRVARLLGVVAIGSEIVTMTLTEQAIDGYKAQRNQMSPTQ